MVSSRMNRYTRSEIYERISSERKSWLHCRWVLPFTEQIDVGRGDICNCKWAGVSVRELLRRSGFPEEIASNKGEDMAGLHLCFASHVAACQEDEWFGASIPLGKALDEDGDVLLAYEMNGNPLSPDHGHPLRMVVPGFSGVRWVKWVDRITVSRMESENYYHQKDYKVLPPQVETHEMADHESWWSRLPPLQANPLSSVIAVAEIIPRTTSLHVKGYAISGTSGPVCKVEISIDAGKTWKPTTIIYQEGRWSWTLWETKIDLPATRLGSGKAWSRALCPNGETQQLDTDWNLRGVAFSAVGEKSYMQ
ncbi:Oxidoreductase, molybdopterin-binding domain-containing protein [Amylocystis lapponica]|nr:Oxidoreductase, molybdopterin-binding domain-containing protein [Amylocystis lapponica]